MKDKDITVYEDVEDGLKRAIDKSKEIPSADKLAKDFANRRIDFVDEWYKTCFDKGEQSMKVDILTSADSISEQIRNIELAGRVCWESYVGRNLDKKSAKEFIKKILKRGHESVIEHSLLTVRFRGVSRGFTHQIVRHRLCSFSQRSTRYVNEKDFVFVRPTDKEDSDKNKKVSKVKMPFLVEGMTNEMNWRLSEIEDFYRSVYEGLLQQGWKKEDARQFLPIGVETEIVVSANFRQWRHIFELRLDKHAHWEIRKAMFTLLKKVVEPCSPIFDDIAEKYLDNFSCT